MQHFAERHFSKLIFAIWVFAALIVLFVSRDAISSWKMGDPDDQLRLLQVRDWIAGQSWWDVTQYRMNPPDGGPMHWSRLVDIPLAGMILLLTPILGAASAEHVTAAVVPLLTLGVAFFFYAAATRRLFGTTEALVACGLIITVIPVLSQLLPMRIDHHGWQLVCFFAALWALFDREVRWQSAVVLGSACALWIEISIEGLPFAALLLGLSALRWVFPSLSPAPVNEGRQFPIALLSTAAGACLLFSVTDSWNAASFCDALSPFHGVALAGMAAVVLAGSPFAQRFGTVKAALFRIVLGAVAAATGAAIIFGMAPQCAGDAFAELDPLVREYWYQRVPEGLPLWAVQIDFAIQQYAYLFAGCVALGYLFKKDLRLSLANKIALSVLFIGSALIGMLVGRAAVYAISIANLLLAAMLIDLFASAEQTKGLSRRMGLRIMALCLAMPSIPAQAVLQRINAAKATNNPKRDALNKDFIELARACQATKAAADLAKLPTSQLMAGLDSSPAILQFTDHKVVATGHHRNQDAMADVIRFFIGSESQAARIMAERKAEYLVICDGSFELALYERKMPNGFLAQLRRGKIPAWLERYDDIGPFQVYRVKNAALPLTRSAT